MILRKFDFTDNKHQSKFNFEKKLHFSTWEHYCICYGYTLTKIFDSSLNKNYPFNCRSRGILFLFRHYIELSIKRNLCLHGFLIPNDHDLKNLQNILNNHISTTGSFQDIISNLNIDSDGSCFRFYINKKTGLPFFTHNDKIDFAKLIKSYCELAKNEELKLDNIFGSIEYNNKAKNYDFIFYMGECTGLGNIRTQYDLIIEFLIEGLLFRNYDIDRIYLPLLFLIRHSLELALKFNILESINFANIVCENDLERIHSLYKLYELFGGVKGYINRIDIEKMDSTTRIQFDIYKKKYEELNNTIHHLDSNSYIFRFPKNKNGKNHTINMKGFQLYEILKLYYFTDTFITFINDTIMNEGLELSQ